jgi:6-pyruvoyltetrahydropterin/6-carboxytetrahydropterin synthase
MYVIHIAKEPLKFSCSHFTIFSEKRAERLHGHNYQVSVAISIGQIDSKLGLAFDFNEVKPMIHEICQSLDECILVPLNSPYLKVDVTDNQVDVRFGQKFYSFPQEDTVLLPIVNISTEELAKLISERLIHQMAPLPHWTSLKVNVEETRGQSISYTQKR